MENLNQYLPYLDERSDYQRDNFDKFLKKVSFSFDVPAIHIAGTNGKGSTATYIASIYQCSGRKVALYTSPYFYNINEMIKIDGKEISDERIEQYINKYKSLFEKYRLSAFEIETFIALTYFQDEGVDVAIIECGMGGLVDATNIFIPVLSIITSVSLEHTMYLGQSIAEIAYQKAGIIKEEIPVLIGNLDKEAENTITEVASDNNSKIFTVATTFNINHHEDGISFNYRYLEDIKLLSKAVYSCYDASFAIEAIYILNENFAVNDQQIREGLLKVNMPLRMEIVSTSPLMILDGGHNLEAIKSLVKAINSEYPNKTIHVIFSCFKDKNLTLMLPELALLSEDITLTTFDHVRARNEEDYFLFLEEYKFDADYVHAVNSALHNYPDDLILVTGSLAFTSVVKKSYMEGIIKYE